MLVFEYKIISYEYFMFRLQDYEIDDLLKYIPYSNKQAYEQTRLILWGVLSPYLKTKKSPEQILPLATDKKEIERLKDKPIENEKIDDIRNKIMNIWGKK